MHNEMKSDNGASLVPEQSPLLQTCRDRKGL